ncbi:hypothetical protein ZTR_10019 [Talaromyces verruculosus]|nr:hypothetical protein ZTR_10019 [Talaromyces verruculosus]
MPLHFRRPDLRIEPPNAEPQLSHAVHGRARGTVNLDQCVNVRDQCVDCPGAPSWRRWRMAITKYVILIFARIPWESQQDHTDLEGTLDIPSYFAVRPHYCVLCWDTNVQTTTLKKRHHEGPLRNPGLALIVAKQSDSRAKAAGDHAVHMRSSRFRQQMEGSNYRTTDIDRYHVVSMSDAN